MYHRLIKEDLSRSKPFCLLGAKGVGKTTLARDFAGKFSNWILLDLETEADRSIFRPEATVSETLKAISFLKGKELRGNGTLIVLDEIGKCPEAIRWAGEMVDKGTRGRGDEGTSGQGDEGTRGQGDEGTRGPFVVAVSSVMTKELEWLLNPEAGRMSKHYVYPFSFEEFLMVLDDPASLEAFREVPVPYYAYEKLLTSFHLYALIGGMPEITGEYAANRHISGLKNIYGKIEDRFIQVISDTVVGSKSLELAQEVVQNTYPYAATRISFSHFGNINKGSREISKAFKALEKIFFLQLILPVTTSSLPPVPDTFKSPRLHLLDTGLVNYFSGIQKSLFQSHDMNAIFEGQIARQVVGQEILATEKNGYSQGDAMHFWVRNKAQSTAEVDFVIRYNDHLIPVVVKAGEPGRLRSLHQFIDMAPHPYAVRLHAGKLAVQQTQTIRGKKFYLLNLPYFLAGKIREHLKGFIRLADGT
jgi:predicted AAA+ superfamily ATPase